MTTTMFAILIFFLLNGNIILPTMGIETTMITPAATKETSMLTKDTTAGMEILTETLVVTTGNMVGRDDMNATMTIEITIAETTPENSEAATHPIIDRAHSEFHQTSAKFFSLLHLRAPSLLNTSTTSMIIILARFSTEQ